jgi:RNA polymerase sigma factor (sigma-70 family)
MVRGIVSKAARALVRELKEGDSRGAVHLVGMYRGVLIGQGRGVFGLRREDAEEIADDVLLTVVEKIGSFEFKRGDFDFHAWILAIFRNRVRDFVRRRALTGGLLFWDEGAEGAEGAEGGEGGGRGGGRSGGVEREVVAEIVRQYQEGLQDSTENASEKLAAIDQVLEEMEPWERILLRSRALEIPYEEIARYAGKSAATLKVYHNRVMKKFVKRLTEYFPELADYAA